MLRPRIIPSLLIHDNGLVKTKYFKNPVYVGDPINAVKIFNEKEVDELIVSDIDATVLGNEPNFDLIKKFAEESRMPLCYSGGVKKIDHVSKIIQLGIEKVGISSGAINNLDFIKEASELVGSQSVVAILDVKKNFLGRYSIFINNGTIKIKNDIKDVIKSLQDSGIGEIVINSIDRDGTQEGYDLQLISQIMNYVKVPITILGGAGSFEHIKSLVKSFGIVGVAAGSLFVFQGRYNAVLINFLPKEDLKEIAEITNKTYKI